MTTRRQIAARMKPSAIHGRRERLKGAIAALLPETDREAAFSELSAIPPQLLHLRNREWQKWQEWQEYTGTGEIPVDWSDTAAAQGELFAKEKPDWKRNPARLIKRLQSSPRPLEALTHGRGKPPCPYHDLILFDVGIIENLIGQPFTYTRGIERGQISGKKVDVLIAALECQLFACGSPPEETIIGIIKAMHE